MRQTQSIGKRGLRRQGQRRTAYKNNPVINPQTKAAAQVEREVELLRREREAAKAAGFKPNGVGTALLQAGNWLGERLGFSKIFGSGAYSMSGNTCFDVAQQVPIMHSSSETVRFRHREYIGDISANGNFNSYSYPVNPGLNGTFPYLSQIAANFQEYRFRGLVFEYKSSSATAITSGTNTALGTVSLAAQYRSDAPALTNKVALMNEMWAVDCKPSDNVVLPIECAPAECPTNVQYVRTGGLLTNQDPKFFDLCNITCAVTGAQAGQTNVVGELWASYDVELLKPQAAAITGSNLQWTGMTMQGVNNANNFGTSLTTYENSVGVGVTQSSGTSSVLFPEYGTYAVSLLWYGNAAVIQNNPTIAATGSSALSAFAFTTGGGALGSGICIEFFVRIQPQYGAPSGGGFLGGFTCNNVVINQNQLTMRIAQIPDGTGYTT